MSTYDLRMEETIASKDFLIQRLEGKIIELEGGTCRFHCRTAKDNWIAGFNWARLPARHDDRREPEVEYDEWRKGQRS